MKNSKSDLIFDVINGVVIIFALLLVIYPLYYVVIASISDPNAVSSGEMLFFPVKINFEGYKMIMAHEKIWLGYANSAYYVVLGTILSVVLNLMAGYVMSRRDLPFSKGFTLYFVITMYFGGGLIPTYLWMRDLNLVDTRLIMILIGAVSTYNIIITRSYFKTNLPDELYEAASIDGCGDFKFFLKIAVPLAKPIIAVLTIFAAVAKWNDYFNALVYLIDASKAPLQLVLREILIQNQMNEMISLNSETVQQGFSNIQETMKYGVIIVASLPVMLLYPFAQKYFTQGIMLGAVKG